MHSLQISHCFLFQVWLGEKLFTVWAGNMKGVCAKKLEATLSFLDFSKAFDSIHRGHMEQILIAYGLPKKTIKVGK